MSTAAREETASQSPDRTRLLDGVGLVARLVLGGVLLVAGALKVGDPLSFARSIMAYQLPGLPWEAAQLLGLVMPIIEIVLGVLLLVGLFTRTSAALGVLLMLVFTALIASVWARGISIDCGCFSKGGEVDDAVKKYPWEIARDVGLALLGAWLVWRPRSLFSADGRLFR